MRPPGRAMAGFTLIEMLVVLVILGLSAAILLTRGPSRSVSLELRSSGSAVVEALKLARSEAIATDRTTHFTMDAPHRAFALDGRPQPPLPNDIALVMTEGVGKNRPLEVISFSPDGSSSGGRIILAAGPHRLQVTVDWLTGRVSLRDAS
jgi:general secretion pathway protein H